MEKNYQEMLDQLKDGSLNKLEISTEEFMDFQKVLMDYQQRKSIVGIAKRGGGVIYHFNSGNSSTHS